MDNVGASICPVCTNSKDVTHAYHCWQTHISMYDSHSSAPTACGADRVYSLLYFCHCHSEEVIGGYIRYLHVRFDDQAHFMALQTSRYCAYSGPLGDSMLLQSLHFCLCLAVGTNGLIN